MTRIEHLNFAENLTHLYLQNNRLQKLENLDVCLRLEKLYLGGNQIQVLEGLDKCSHLTEIYLENQRLPHGEKLVFEPRTLQALSKVLGECGRCETGDMFFVSCRDSERRREQSGLSGGVEQLRTIARTDREQ